MSSHILPSDINSNLHQVLMRAKNIHLKKLMSNGREGLDLNQNLFIATSLGTFGTIAACVVAPTVGAVMLPVATPLVFAGLVGSFVVGQYNKYQAKKEQEKVVREFCKIEGIDYQSTLASWRTTTGYKSSFLNKVINESHINSDMKNEDVFKTIEDKSQQATQSTLISLKEKALENVSKITNKIRNSKEAFLKGYSAAKEEFNNPSQKTPKP